MIPLLLCTLPFTAAAEDEPRGDLTPPPMVPLDAPPAPPQPTEPSQAPPPATDAQGVLQPRAIANAPLSPSAATPSTPAQPSAATLADSQDMRARFLAEVGLGVGAALAGALLGSVVWPSLPGWVPWSSLGAGWAGAVLGAALLGPVGVLAGGLWTGSDGAAWGLVLGEVIGLALGSLALWAGSADAMPLMFALPLGAAIVLYEGASTQSRARVSAVVGPQGALGLGVAGAW